MGRKENVDWFISLLKKACRIGRIALIFILLFVAGYFFHSVWNIRAYNGLWMGGNLTEKQALDKAYNYQLTGTWVCINIKGMDYETIVNTCEHEAGHELFAKACEKNDDICRQVQEILRK